MKPISTVETAQWLDVELSLKERLSTALEISRKPSNADWQQLVIADAARHAEKLRSVTVLPWHLPAISRWALLILAVIAGLGFVPEYRTEAQRQREQEKESIREAGARIAELTQRSLQRREPVLEPVRETLQSVEQLGESLSQNPVTRAEALKDLANATEKIKDELRDLGKNPALKPLERAARENARSGNSLPADLQSKMDALQQSLGNKPADSNSLEKLKQDLEKAKKDAASMANANSPESQAARQQMAQTLAELARQANEMGIPLPDLNEAIAALQADQAALFMKEMDAALQDLDKLQEMSRMLQQLQQQASRMGKNLPEQLQNGQAELARQTLEKMMSQLKSGNLTPEQLQKILEEVSKSLDAAKPYGKAGECLGRACDQMKDGNNAAAAKSLAEAAEELKKLLEQMNDAQQLMAAMDALKRAQMCVGNNLSWGQCKSSMVGFKPGGKGGAGVGTWAEETGWIYTPEQSDGWDNSGVYRPDMDGRGLSDRDPNLPDTLVPTKVRGQFAPSGPMPGITLKGVHIKGHSTVQYQEAVTAAQSEAQSAINQDKVPRAYRGAVRDYFDDLKE